MHVDFSNLILSLYNIKLCSGCIIYWFNLTQNALVDTDSQKMKRQSSYHSLVPDFGTVWFSYVHRQKEQKRFEEGTE